jgi:hypothetical protein
MSLSGRAERNLFDFLLKSVGNPGRLGTASNCRLQIMKDTRKPFDSSYQTNKVIEIKGKMTKGDESYCIYSENLASIPISGKCDLFDQKKSETKEKEKHFARYLEIIYR